MWWRIEWDSLHNWCGGGLNGTVYTTGVRGIEIDSLYKWCGGGLNVIVYTTGVVED